MSATPGLTVYPKGVLLETLRRRIIALQEDGYNDDFLRAIREAHKELERKEARLAEAERDAARYRWLVSQGDPIIWYYLGGMDDDQIDEAIDKWIADDAHLSRKEGESHE